MTIYPDIPSALTAFMSDLSLQILNRFAQCAGRALAFRNGPQRRFQGRAARGAQGASESRRNRGADQNTNSPGGKDGENPSHMMSLELA